MIKPLSNKNRKIDLLFITSYVKQRGGELVGCYTKLNSLSRFFVKCKKGHTWETSGTNVVCNDRWCPYCAKNRINETDIIAYIESIGGILREDFKYINSTSKFSVICSNNHSFETYWSNINSGYWCPYCAKNKVDKNDIVKYIYTVRMGL